MAVRIAFKGLSGAALFICIVGLIAVATVPMAQAASGNMNLTVDHSLRFADGYSRSIATVTVTYLNGTPMNNANVTFYEDTLSPVLAITNSAGIANFYTHPHTSYFNSSIIANYGSNNISASVQYLEQDNLFLLPDPGYTGSVSSNAGIHAVFYKVFNTSMLKGIPLTFTAYAPNFSIISTYSTTTDPSGVADFNFVTSSMVGNNTIIVTNSDLGMIGGVVIFGSGGQANNILIQTVPGTPIVADGTSSYTLKIWVRDSGNNPVINVPIRIVMHASDYDRIVNQTTNSNGYVEMSTGPSSYVQSVPVTVTDLDLPTVNTSTTLQFTPGPATNLVIRADPVAVASSNIANITQGVSIWDVHQTDIRCTLLDLWGHPISNQLVTVSSMNTTAGNITGALSGMTDANGEFLTSFELGTQSNGTGIVTVKAVSGSLTSTSDITYTDVPFLSVKTGITPRNASLNSNITVNINVTGIGWMIRSQPLDVMLVIDRSGSMDWFSTALPGYPITATIPSSQAETYVPLATYTNDGSQSDFEILLSSPITPYAKLSGSTWSGSYYDNLMVGYQNGYYQKKVNGKYVDDLTRPKFVNLTGSNSGNENELEISDSTPRTYTIFGSLHYDNAYTNAVPPCNISVLVSPKRLGQDYEPDTAAKIAAVQFMKNLSATQDEVGIASFNTAGTLDSYNATYKRALLIDSPSNRTFMSNVVENLDANGGTQMNTGMDAAINELQSHNRLNINNSGINAKKVIILLTDGYSQSPTADNTSTLNAKQDGITIYTIGMGMADDSKLNWIATTTGGTNTHVFTDIQLTQAYSDILSSLQTIVANQSTMFVSTNRTLVNGTIVSDAEYVPGSAVIRNPNGTVFTPPVSDPTIVSNNTEYRLVWSPGTIKLNEMWNLTYKLTVLKNGTINPINNDSYIIYYRVDNGVNTTYTTKFGGDAIFVNNSSGPGMWNNTGVISISNAQTANQTEMPINWTVKYNGTSSYVQDLSYMGSDGIILPIPAQYLIPVQSLSSNAQQKSWPMTWDTRMMNGGKGLKPGDYTLIIHAYEINGAEAFAYPTFSIPYNDNGNIILD